MRIAEGRGLRILLVGAMAQQLAFNDRYEIEPERATLDIDVVVRVDSWTEFTALADILTQHGFTKRGDHSFLYRDGTEIDVIPFGGVADATGSITWPRSGNRLSIEGMDMAEVNSEAVDRAGMSITIPSLPSLVALKLYAFRDRFHDTQDDLKDLTHILFHASNALLKRIYQELVEELVEFPYEQLGAYLLGRDLAGIASEEERNALLAIVEERILDAPEYRALNLVTRGSRVDEIAALFKAFRDALAKASQSRTT